MANDKLNKELVSRMMDDAAWKELSKDFPWTEQLLEKYMNYVDWKEISRNNDVVWTKSLLEKFKHRLDWHELTSNSSTLLFTEDNIETFDSVTYNEEFLEKYGDYISASELGGSKLWDNIIEHRIKAIKKKILS